MEVVHNSIKNFMFAKAYSRVLKISIWKSILKRRISDQKVLGPTFFSHGALGQRSRCLSLSTAATEQYDADPQNIKEAFVYTDYSKIEDEKKQGLYLTKSILKPGLPSIHEMPLNLDQTLLQSIYKEYEEHLLDSFLFCFGEEELYRKKFSVVNAFLNMTQTTWRKTTSR